MPRRISSRSTSAPTERSTGRASPARTAPCTTTGVDAFGKDTITDFHRSQGDKIEIAGHTAEVKSIEYRDVNHDGRRDSVITVISQQGASGAHDEDLLGTITVFGDLVKRSDITVDAGVTYGEFENIHQLAAGTHYLQEDDGVLPGGKSDGDHHDMHT